MGHGFKHGVGGYANDATGMLVVNAPVGVTVIASKEDKTYRKIVNEEGMAIFKGLSAGEWIVTIDNGIQTSTQRISITLNYSVAMKFFAANISVTYPIGATCTCSDGITTLTASDTSGSCVFVVPNTGTWTVSIVNGEQTRSSNVKITSDGQNETVFIAFFAATIDVIYPEGSVCTCSDGSIMFTASDTSGSYVFTVPNTGTWTVSSTSGDKSDSEDVEIISDGQHETVELAYWHGELFDNGDITEVTGGWTTVRGKITASNGGTLTSDTTPSCTVYNDRIVINTNDGMGFLKHKNLIDLTPYTTVHYSGTAKDNTGNTSINYCQPIIMPPDKTNGGDALKRGGLSAFGSFSDLQVDVKNINQEAYVGWWLYDYGGANADATVTITKIWLT